MLDQSTASSNSSMSFDSLKQDFLKDLQDDLDIKNKFLRKSQKFFKYSIKNYEVTILIQAFGPPSFTEHASIKEILSDTFMQDIFKTMLLKAFPEPNPFLISKIKINTSYFPMQADLTVQFVSKIGKDPFYNNSSEISPILYTKRLENASQIKFIMFIKPQIIRFPEDFTVMAKLGKGSFGQVYLVKFKRDGLLYALKILNNISQKEIEQFTRFLIIQENNYNNIVREIKFLQELKMSQQSKHPNFIELVDYWYQLEESDHQGHLHHHHHIYQSMQQPGLTSCSTLPSSSSSLNSGNGSMNDLDAKHQGSDQNSLINSKSFSFYILMQYFGGIEYYANSLYDAFIPRLPESISHYCKEEDSLPLHADLGINSAREVISQIFYQVLNAIQYMHAKNYCHRDIKDDNIVIRRRSGIVKEIGQEKYSIPFIIDVALIDFGLTGYVDCASSPMHHYLKNSYRDIENVEHYPIACDIYSLGELLKKIIALYFHHWLKGDENDIKQQVFNQMSVEYQLIDLMKSPITVRPKSIIDLKSSKEYIRWIAVIPKYIPLLFSDININ